MVQVLQFKNPAIFIFATILIDAIGLGLLIPVLPEVLRRFMGDSADMAVYFGYFLSIYAGMQFLASPVLGALSDRFGRRPVLLCSMAGAAVDYLLMALAPNLLVLFLGRVISGLTGASMTVAASYLADVSDAKSRAANFGMIGAAWGIGFILGPLLGGLMHGFGPFGPFYGAAILCLINFGYGVFVLPESLPPEKRRTVRISQLNPGRSLIKILSPSPILIYITIYFILFLAGQVHPVNWTIYTQTKFQWSSMEVGFSLSFVGAMMALAQMKLTGIAVKGLGEHWALVLGTAVYTVGFALFGSANQGWMMYPIVVFFAASGMAMPALQSIIAKEVPANAQGELQGSLVSLGSLAAILAPILYTWIFHAATATPDRWYYPGAAYVTASAICLVALVLSFKARLHQ